MGEGLAISPIISPVSYFPFFLNATQTCPTCVPVFLFPVPAESCADCAVVGVGGRTWVKFIGVIPNSATWFKWPVTLCFPSVLTVPRDGTVSWW